MGLPLCGHYEPMSFLMTPKASYFSCLPGYTNIFNGTTWHLHLDMSNVSFYCQSWTEPCTQVCLFLILLKATNIPPVLLTPHLLSYHVLSILTLVSLLTQCLALSWQNHCSSLRTGIYSPSCPCTIYFSPRNTVLPHSLLYILTLGSIPLSLWEIWTNFLVSLLFWRNEYEKQILFTSYALPMICPCSWRTLFSDHFKQKISCVLFT